jgi:hypothetical protein
MATIKRFEEIKAWQKARVLNNEIGTFIDRGQFKRNYRLIDQIEGSAGSIMDNIAEGFERSGNKEFIQFLYVEALTGSISINRNLMNYITWQWKSL